MTQPTSDMRAPMPDAPRPARPEIREALSQALEALRRELWRRDGWTLDDITFMRRTIRRAIRLHLEMKG